MEDEKPNTPENPDGKKAPEHEAGRGKRSQTEKGVIRWKSSACLKHALTFSEKQALIEETAQAVQKKARLNDALKASAQEIKSRIAEQETVLNKNAALICQGYEMRETPIEIEMNYRIGKVIKYRLDTLDVIEDRPMTAEERQQQMGF